MSKRITFGNFKGGVGKTTNACVFSYFLSELGYKTLLVDLDPQRNSTIFMNRTRANIQKDIIDYKTTMMSCIVEKDLSPILTNIKENLYLLPTFEDFTSFPIYLEQLYPDIADSRRLTIMKGLIDNLDKEHMFDYIIIDTPPTLSVITDNAVMLSTDIVIVTQTQERAVDATGTYIKYLQELYNNFDVDYNIVGILPVMFKKNETADEYSLNNIYETFGENNIFNNIIPYLARLKRWDVTGMEHEINDDIHEKKVYDIYKNATKELIERIEHNE